MFKMPQYDTALELAEATVLQWSVNAFPLHEVLSLLLENAEIRSILQDGPGITAECFGI